MYALYPRALYFKDGKCIRTRGTEEETHVVNLPSDHYDFLGPIKIEGKTLENIEAEVFLFMHTLFLNDVKENLTNLLYLFPDEHVDESDKWRIKSAEEMIAKLEKIVSDIKKKLSE